MAKKWWPSIRKEGDATVVDVGASLGPIDLGRLQGLYDAARAEGIELNRIPTDEEAAFLGMTDHEKQVLMGWGTIGLLAGGQDEMGDRYAGFVRQLNGLVFGARD